MKVGLKKRGRTVKMFGLNLSVRTTLTYFLISAVWIILSDRVVDLISVDQEMVTFLSSIKGMFFVVTTSILLLVLINRDLNKRNTIILELNSLLQTKDELNRELHHRIKNNLQTIISLIGLEPGAGALIEEFRFRLSNRLMAMKSVFNVVYDLENLNHLSLAKVLAEYKVERGQDLVIEPQGWSVNLNIEAVVPLILALDSLLDPWTRQYPNAQFEIRFLSDREICLSDLVTSDHWLPEIPSDEIVQVLLGSIQAVCRPEVGVGLRIELKPTGGLNPTAS